MPEETKEILIRQTVTITRRVGVRSYPYMSPKQAVEYERSLPLEDKLSRFASELEYVTDEDLEYSETITIQDRPKS